MTWATACSSPRRCRDFAPSDECIELADSGNTLLTVNGALFIGGGALAAVGATLLIIDLTSGSAEEPPASATLRIGPSGAAFKLAF